MQASLGCTSLLPKGGLRPVPLKSQAVPAIHAKARIERWDPFLMTLVV